MDILKKIKNFAGKYRYAVLVLAVGMVLMLLPTSGEKTDEAEEVPQVQENADVARELEEILGQIDGVGKVKVMLTVASGETTVYQFDENGENRDTVIITDSSRSEAGLIQQVNPPVYLGAIVVCQGGDSAVVRLDVIEAVSKVTGLGTDRISVLKMK